MDHLNATMVGGDPEQQQLDLFEFLEDVSVLILLHQFRHTVEEDGVLTLSRCGAIRFGRVI